MSRRLAYCTNVAHYHVGLFAAPTVPSSGEQHAGAGAGDALNSRHAGAGASDALSSRHTATGVEKRLVKSRFRGRPRKGTRRVDSVQGQWTGCWMDYNILVHVHGTCSSWFTYKSVSTWTNPRFPALAICFLYLTKCFYQYVINYLYLCHLKVKPKRRLMTSNRL